MKRLFVVSVFIALWGFCLNTFAGLYYPLEEGRTWLYQFSASTKLTSVKGELGIQNFSRRKLETKEVTPQKVEFRGEGSNQSHFIFITEDESGVYEWARQNTDDIDPTVHDNPICQIRYPAKVGTEWKAPVEITLLEMVKSEVQATFRVEKVDDIVTVPAGTFENCLRIQATAETQENLGFYGIVKIKVEYHLWYAPNVGLLKQISTERSNNLMTGSGKLTLQLMRSGKTPKDSQE